MRRAINEPTNQQAMKAAASNKTASVGGHTQATFVMLTLMLTPHVKNISIPYKLTTVHSVAWRR